MWNVVLKQGTWIILQNDDTPTQKTKKVFPFRASLILRELRHDSLAKATANLKKCTETGILQE